jgi:hypothetical protein
VRKEIRGRCTLLGLILCVSGLPVCAEGGRPPEVSLTVAVHDHAGVPADTLDEAERTASLLFKQAGVNVEWANCESPGDGTHNDRSCHITQFPQHLQLVIVRRSKNLTDSVFGISYLGEDGSGCYIDVFFEPAEELHERLHVHLATLLGHVVAHEIAHLLLGTNSHSDTGIMRAHWDGRDLANAGKGELLFTRAQGQRMRARVSVSSCPTERALVTVGSGRD